jgi:uncharacterized lipoprotein YddW (UPF0748 family)
VKKYVQYTISVTVSAEEPLEDVVYDDTEDWTEKGVRDYIKQEKWDFLSDLANSDDWNIDVRLVEKDD